MRLLSFVFLTLLFCWDVSSQQKDLPPYASEHWEEVLNYSETDSILKPYIVDLNDLEYLISKSDKKYKILYPGSYYCTGVLATLPPIILYTEAHKESFDLFIIFGDKYKKIPNILGFMDFQEYYQPFFILDIQKLGNKKTNPNFRLQKMLKYFCPECNEKKMGYSAFLVLDESNNVITYSHEKMSFKEDVDTIKNLPLN